MARHMCPDPQRTKANGKCLIPRYRRLWYDMAEHTGKRGRAVDVEACSMAPAISGEETPHTEEANNVITPTVESEIQIFDMYIVGHNPKHTAQPFIHQLNICPPNGEVIPVRASFDDGTLINAMSTTKFNNIKHRLGHYKPSTRLLRMANGIVVGATAVWEGVMEVEGVKTHASFEVFEKRRQLGVFIQKTAAHSIQSST